MLTFSRDFCLSVNVNTDILEPLHTGIAIFDSNCRLMFANSAYRKMYNLKDEVYIGLDATSFFITAEQGIIELLRTGESNSCESVSITGLHGITYRWPLRDKDGRVVGCMTENISVSSQQNKISEMQEIINDLEGYSKFSTLLYPRHATDVITFGSIAGESASMRLLKEKGRRFAQHDEPILILGENGTGKDMVAQAIHTASSRSSKNFVAINCAAIPHELMESELFGYETGAFTGAKASGKKGFFEQADGGTIFLDEIGEMPLTLQSKLLRVLENYKIQKLGNPNPIHVDFRLLSATNRNLEQMVAQGLFREDLYYRLNLFDLTVPPLCERLADIPLLAYSILAKLLGPERVSTVQIEKEVLSVFSIHPWKGNVRELRNVLTYALYSMQDAEVILRIHHLPDRFFQKIDNDFLSNLVGQDEEKSDYQHSQVAPLEQILSDNRAKVEREVILDALKKSGGNKAQAARLLGVSRSNLYKKIAMHSLSWKII